MNGGRRGGRVRRVTAVSKPSSRGCWEAGGRVVTGGPFVQPGGQWGDWEAAWKVSPLVGLHPEEVVGLVPVC